MIDRVIRYGFHWPSLAKLMGCDARALTSVPPETQQAWYDYFIELKCIALPNDEKPPEYEGWFPHAKRLSQLLWGDPQGKWYFEFNPNAVKIIQAFQDYKWIGIAGSRDSSKTQSIAWCALMFYLQDPHTSKVIIGSTTLDTALAKIFAEIEKAWYSLSDFFWGQSNLPASLSASKGLIKSVEIGRGAGMEVIPGDHNSEKKNMSKFAGYKPGGWGGRLMFVGNEVAGMSKNIIDMVVSNYGNHENFKGMVDLNPSDENDASKPFTEPKEGFGSITVDDDSWETKLPNGICLHFDGLKSPNVLAGRNADGKYPWRGLYSRESLKDDTEFYIEKSAAYWQMVRGFWPPTGSDECIYSNPEVRQYKGQDHAVFIDVPVKVAACDPAFKLDGDRAVAHFGLCGFVEGPYGKPMRCLQYTEHIILAEEADKEMSKDEQVARQYIEECKKRGVQRQDAAYDATSGAGATWGTLIKLLWGDGPLGIDFGGTASEMPVAATSGNIPANEMYVNRMSEIWHVGKHLIRSGQIKGISDGMLEEMVKRKYKQRGGRVVVESKKDMKKRTGKSPDVADSGYILLDLCRQRHGLIPTEKVAPAPSKSIAPYGQEFPFPGLKPASNWRGFVAKFDFSH